MPTPPNTEEELIEASRLVLKHKGNMQFAANELGKARSTIQHRVENAKARRIYQRIEAEFLGNSIPAQPIQQPQQRTFDIEKEILGKTVSIQYLSEKSGLTIRGVLDEIDNLKARGLNILETQDGVTISKVLQSSKDAGNTFEYVSRPDNTYVFGALGDSHLASKYARIDCLNALYDFFTEEGVDRVFHTGNWIDGEASFNVYDLLVRGMDAQCKYLAKNYPQRAGIKTYAIAGDDHEGWYCQKSGVNIGKYAENIMREMGRDDWVDCGYMEASFLLKNANTGKTATLLSAHPGGGTSYATSYTVQQLVNSLEGGEKPDVLLVGHYHKLETIQIRNVWVCQTGSTKDQDPFMRKKRIDSQIGGYVITLKQDPQTGAIVRCKCDLLRFFNRGFYEDRNNRWSHSGDVVLPNRGA